MYKSIVVIIIAIFLLALGAAAGASDRQSVDSWTSTRTVLAGEEGGRLDGTPWSSDELVGRVWVLLYVRPHQSEWFDPLYDSLAAAKFPRARTGSIVVANLDRSYWPVPIVKQALRQKQKKYASTVYVVDRNGLLEERWKLPADSSTVLLFGPEGNLLYSRSDVFDAKDASKVIRVIRSALQTSTAFTQAAPLHLVAPDIRSSARID